LGWRKSEINTSSDAQPKNVLNAAGDEQEDPNPSQDGEPPWEGAGLGLWSKI
jgi:hypothetical protein